MTNIQQKKDQLYQRIKIMIKKHYYNTQVNIQSNLPEENHIANTQTQIR